MEKEILAVKTKNKISFREARETVENMYIEPGITFASRLRHHRDEKTKRNATPITDNNAAAASTSRATLNNDVARDQQNANKRTRNSPEKNETRKLRIIQEHEEDTPESTWEPAPTFPIQSGSKEDLMTRLRRIEDSMNQPTEEKRTNPKSTTDNDVNRISTQQQLETTTKSSKENKKSSGVNMTKKGNTKVDNMSNKTDSSDKARKRSSGPPPKWN